MSRGSNMPVSSANRQKDDPHKKSFQVSLLEGSEQPPQERCFKLRSSNPFYSRPLFPSPWMIPDRSSPSRVRFAPWTAPGPIWRDAAVHDGKTWVRRTA